VPQGTLYDPMFWLAIHKLVRDHAVSQTMHADDINYSWQSSTPDPADIRDCFAYGLAWYEKEGMLLSLTKTKVLPVSSLESIQSKCTRVFLPDIQSYIQQLKSLALSRLEDFMVDQTCKYVLKI